MTAMLGFLLLGNPAILEYAVKSFRSFLPFSLERWLGQENRVQSQNLPNNLYNRNSQRNVNEDAQRKPKEIETKFDMGQSNKARTNMAFDPELGKQLSLNDMVLENVE